MLASLGNKLRHKMTTIYAKIAHRYSISERSLREHISMKPKDILGRSIAAGNWSTLLVIIVIYPTLLYFRGFDWQLLGGMVFMYVSFWTVVVLAVLAVQVVWLINYCISQRFVENMLDFEILERLFGQDRAIRDEYDEDDDDDEDIVLDDNETLDSNGRLRATG